MSSYNLLHFTVAISKESHDFQGYFSNYSESQREENRNYDRQWKCFFSLHSPHPNLQRRKRRIRIWRRQFCQWQIKLDLQGLFRKWWSCQPSLLLSVSPSLNFTMKTNNFNLIHSSAGTTRASPQNDIDDRKWPLNSSTWMFISRFGFERWDEMRKGREKYRGIRKDDFQESGQFSFSSSYCVRLIELSAFQKDFLSQGFQETQNTFVRFINNVSGPFSSTCLAHLSLRIIIIIITIFFFPLIKTFYPMCQSDTLLSDELEALYNNSHGFNVQ